jgi:uncharacterized protein YkwD
MMLDRLFQLFLITLCVGLAGAATAQMIDNRQGIGGAGQAAQSVGAQSSPDLDEAAQEIVDRTNEFRRNQDRQSLEVDAQLEETARYFADFMARTDKYGHEADGTTPSDRARDQGYDLCIVSENLAFQFSSAGFATEELVDAAVEGWKQSPGHRKNMLDPDVTETGVALARSDRSGKYYAVQMFGRPRSMSIEFQVINTSDVTIEYEIDERILSLPARAIQTHEQCRPSELSFRLPGSEAKTVQPADGDRYRIEREGSGNLRLSGG